MTLSSRKVDWPEPVIINVTWEQISRSFGQQRDPFNCPIAVAASEVFSQIFGSDQILDVAAMTLDGGIFIEVDHRLELQHYFIPGRAATYDWWRKTGAMPPFTAEAVLDQHCILYL